MERRTIIFTGRVQGVGFRQTTWSLAREFEVAGYVRNLADGRVELVVEGAPGEIEAFVIDLEERWRGSIQEREVSAQPAAFPHYHGFEIRT